MMKTSYDPEADAFSVWFAPEGVQADHTREVAPGVLVDFDAHGNALGIEVLSVQARVAGRYPATGAARAAE
jgi:uncharacterized protein YuzE